MISIKAKIIERSGATQRQINPLVKEALQIGLRYWLARYLGPHFTKRAYERYPEVYPKPDPRRKRPPLVMSGSLRDHVKNPNHARISGTSKQATAKILYGRPRMYKTPEIRAKIYMSQAEREGRKLFYKEALRMAYANYGYGEKAKTIFQKRIAYLNDQEIEKIEEIIVNYVVDRLNTPVEVKTTMIQA